MKKLLIVTAGRPNGNSEILAKEAAMEAEREGKVEVSEIRLHSLRIKPCIGCESCMNSALAGGDGKCIQRGDDFEWLFEQTLNADGILVASPIYNLMPPGVLINVLNRAIGSGAAHQKQCNTHPKVGAIICVGGSDWTELALPIAEFSLTRLAKGTVTVDKLLVDYNSVKSMVLLDDDALERARQLGKKLHAAMFGQIEKYDGGICPGCHNDIVRVGADGRITCAICGAKARLQIRDGESVIAFEEGSVAKNRLTVIGFQKHLDEVRQVHETAAAGAEKIRTRLKSYQAYNPCIHPIGRENS